MVDFWSQEPLVSRDLDLVKLRMEEAVSQARGYIRPYIQEVIRQQGKMLRPACVISASKFGKEERSGLSIDLAAGVELIHLASLVHDDIIDQAEVRRGEPTLRSRIGNRKAVVSGDYLLARAFSLLTRESADQIDLDPRRVSHRISRLCESEIDQDGETGDFTISISHYLRRIGGKTASLFSLSCYLGAAAGGVPLLQSRRLTRLGYHMGMLFQIQDDILDYNGKEQQMGKDAGKDLLEGVATLPVLYALKQDSSGELSSLLSRRPLDSAGLVRAVELVDKLGGLHSANQMAERYLHRARRDLEMLPSGEARKFFFKLLTVLINRQQ